MSSPSSFSSNNHILSIFPISVRKWKDGKYMIVAGERRWRAHKVSGLKTIQAFVKEYDDDIDWQIESLVENLYREDLSSVEKENSLYKIWKSNKFKTYSELSKRLGMNDVTIAQIIHAKEVRTKTKAAVEITTRTISDTQGLDDNERKQIFKKIEKGKLVPQDVRKYTKAVKQSTPDVKKALFDDEINVEQAERISKLKPEQRKKAIQEHKNISMVEKGVERNIKNQESVKEKREFDKRLLQAGNWIASFRGSVTDSFKSLEKTIKILLISTQFINVMDEKQKEKLEEQLDRFLEILNKAKQLSEQIEGKIK